VTTEPGSEGEQPRRDGGDTPTVAVIAHTRKNLGRGLDDLRRQLDDAGVARPLWYEVPKSKRAARCARDAVARGADLLFVWGGDGTVQRCIDAVAGSSTALAVLPAGTSNLLATNLGIPTDLRRAVRIGLQGERRTLDTGTVNGEHFAVVAGAGLDALLVRDADSGLKERFGRAAYLFAGVKNLTAPAMRATVTVDGRRLYRGRTTCVLVGNMRKTVGGIDVFHASEPDDGLLEVGVVSAEGPPQWLTTFARLIVGRARTSPLVETSRGRSITVELRRPAPYELDGGDRKPVRTLSIEVQPSSITVCVAPAGPGTAPGRLRGARQTQA
jgi:diacylglycerol kinase (ATP)